VRLEIYQEISNVVESATATATDGPTTSKRSASTTVVIKDHETMVIGGLIRDNVTSAERKVPFFGDIPLLGWLFKYKTSKVEKVNLMIFITPYIIKNEHDAQDITKRKAEALEKFRDEYRIEKKDMGGLVETKKPASAPTGTVSMPPAAAKPVEVEGKAAAPAAQPAAKPVEVEGKAAAPASPEGTR